MSKSKSILLNRSKGSKSPLFCIYGVFLYYFLARHLGNERPIYAIYIEEEVELLQARQKEIQQTELISVVNLATRYLEIIRKQQPIGPYLLAGESFGGLIAFEIAQQLLSQGEKVSLLALFDTSAPGEKKVLQVHQRLWLHIENFLQQVFPYILGRIKRRINTVDDTISNLRREAIEKYKPLPYPGKIIYFQAMNKSNFEVAAHNLLKWQNLTLDELEVHHIPGDHVGILKEPHVQTLAKNLKFSINKAG